MGGSFSTWEDVISGVPQGSVLGPILFVCYINDLPENIASFIYMYADDTKVFRRADCEQDRLALQRDLDELADWAGKWQLRFNVDKCRTMHLGGLRNIHAKYIMATSNGGQRMELQETVEEKDLGVWTDDTGGASSHVAHIVQKANQILGLIRRTFTYMDCNLMRQLFTSVVRPHLEYANVVWHPYLKKDIALIEGVQHRATRMVPGLAKLPYEDRLRRLDLPTLSYRRTRGDVIEAYKYLHGMYDVDCSALLPLHESAGVTTRGNGLKLKKRECRTQKRSNFFGLRVVNIWNGLPSDVVMAPTVNCLKGRFDRFCIDKRYCEDWR